MNTKKIKTAVIGAGNMGKNHARVYSEISNLVAIADVNPDIGKPIAQKYNVPYYQDYLEMIDKEKPNAVSAVVPTKFHHQVTINCLNKGIPTLCEKPIASSVVEADEMIKTAKKNQIFLMVGHVERFNPAVIKLKKLIDENKLGKIINLVAIRVGVVPPKTQNSDVALDLGIHDIDVFNYLLDEIPIKHSVLRNKLFQNNIADNASITLNYKYATGFIQTNWFTPIKMRKLYVTGTDGFAEVDYINQKITVFDKILVTKQNGEYLDLISLSQEPKKEVYVSKKEPLKEELKFFLGNLNNYKDQKIANSSLKAISILE